MASLDPSGRRWILVGRLLVGLAGVLLLKPRAQAHVSGRRPTTGSAEAATAASRHAASNPTQGGGDPDDHVFDCDSTDADAGVLARVMLVAVLTIGLSVGGLFLLLARFHAADAQPMLTPEQAAFIPPPGPPLQDDPLRDIAALRLRETALLTGYAWLDPDHRHARLPIVRAEALVAGQSLDPNP